MGRFTRTIGMGSIAMGFSTVLGIVSSIITVPLFLGSVGIDGYGLFILISSVIGFVSIGDFGMLAAVGNAISYLWAEKKTEDISKLFSGTLIVVAMLVFGIWVILVCLLWYTNISVAGLFGVGSDQAVIARTLFFLLLFFTSLQVFFGGVVSALFRGLNQLPIFHKAQSFYVGLYSVSFILFLLTRPSLINIAMFQGVASLIRVVGFYVFASFQFSWLRFSLSFSNIRLLQPLVKFSGMFFVLLFGNSLISKTDLLVLSHVVGVSATTPFSIADRVFKIPSSIVQVATASEPSISILYQQKDSVGLGKLYGQVMRMNMIFKITPLLFLLVFSREFISLWVGAELFTGYLVLSCFFFSYCIYAWVGPHFAFINAMFQHKVEMLPMVINVLINGFFSIVLALQYGLIGVIMGTVLGNLLTNAWYLPLYLRRQLPIKPFAELGRIFVSFFFPALFLVSAHYLIVLLVNGDMWQYILAFLTGILYLAIISHTVFQKSERRFVIDRIRTRLRHFNVFTTNS